MAIQPRRLIVKMVKRVSAQFPRSFPLVWSVPDALGRIAITFDDGPTELTPKILDCLASSKTQATFFVLGNEVARRPDILRQIVAEGHEIGIHAYEHNNQHYCHQVRRCEKLLAELGVTPHVLRPPSCKIQPLDTVRLWWRGYRTIIYNIDTHDSMRLENKWQGSPPNYSLICSGDIILMHDDKLLCLQELPELLQWVQKRQLRAVTVSEMLESTTPVS